MFNADDIIKLEQKWFKYKLKQKVKLPIFIIIVLLVATAFYYFFYYSKALETQSSKVVKEKTLNPIIKVKEPKITPVVEKKENNITKEKVTTFTPKNEENIKVPINKVKDTNASKKTNTKYKKVQKPFFFTLAPTIQKNELFYSEGTLSFNPPYSFSDLKEIPIPKTVPEEVNEPKKEKVEPKKEKTNVSISMKEVDTITYLKEKFYSSSNIVFALMLAEEYYNKENYTQSAKWSLSANDIDPANDKSWYWFAKAKVKMGQKEDALRALKAYLRNNKSERLSTLLNKLEFGENQ